MVISYLRTGDPSGDWPQRDGDCSIPLGRSGAWKSLISSVTVLQLAGAGVAVRQLADPAAVEIGEAAAAEAGRREVSGDVVEVKALRRGSLDGHLALLISGSVPRGVRPASILAWNRAVFYGSRR
jgi:hypothetical protein